MAAVSLEEPWVLEVASQPQIELDRPRPNPSMTLPADRFDKHAAGIVYVYPHAPGRLSAFDPISIGARVSCCVLLCAV